MITVKRSMSPDGKIDSVSVELTLDSPLTDTQAVLDAIALTDTYASYVNSKTPAPRPNPAAFSSAAADGGPQTLVGNIQAVYDGEPAKNGSGKMGPAAIIIDGIKVKTFDKKLVQTAKDLKGRGQAAVVTYVRNEQWKSNDVKTLEAAS